VTYEQVEAKKAKAVRFVRDVLQDDDRADEIESEPVAYISNPLERRVTMANSGMRKDELLDRIDELESENWTPWMRFRALFDSRERYFRFNNLPAIGRPRAPRIIGPNFPHSTERFLGNVSGLKPRLSGARLLAGYPGASATSHQSGAGSCDQ
jgi:hypothetical protein